MAVINEYKFYGANFTSSVETPVLTAGATETFIVKSFRVTNNTANTPTITIKNDGTMIVNTQQLDANASTEILTLPLIVEQSKSVAVTMSSSDSVDIGISYLNIKKEVTT